ncbi:translation initiation factor eIF4e [Rickenella mellea]|uniref:Translation initiation factor eIF4e n=1 Tax=Rickenella mellea TaxID=50990 RepID=A0A4Y7QB11_9AGAM|nr:translation initiation factor eIF4e [Rickenella mellea]
MTESTTPPTSTSTTQAADVALKPERPAPSGRMPSLNQLAARMNANAKADSNQSPAGSAASSRPRLAASILRTGSQVSISSAAASAADSTIVNPPTTRSGSPNTLSSRASSPAASARSATSIPNGGEPLTADKLEKLNAENPSEKKVKVGYKNIPSLDAITARLAMARTLSVDGSTKPPEPETYEDPATPGIPQKAPEHPLQHTWTLYHDTKSKVPFTPASAVPNSADGTAAHPPVKETDDYEAGLTVIGDFSTVETFCRYFNWLKPPSALERNSNYHLFKAGIKPMWEDPANAKGGKWVLTMKNNAQLLDRCWSWLAMALVGEELDEGDEICGAVVSLRSKVDRIQLWVRGKEDVERANSIGKKLVKLLDVSDTDGIGLEFQYNSDDRPPPNKFLSIHATFPQSSFRSTFGHTPAHSLSALAGAAGVAATTESGPASAGPVPGPGAGAGAFGGFGGGPGWRGGRRGGG